MPFIAREDAVAFTSGGGAGLSGNEMSFVSAGRVGRLVGWVETSGLWLSGGAAG